MSRLMSFVLDILCVLAMGFVAASTIYLYRGKVDGAKLAFSLQIITDVIAWFSVSLRFLADLANFFTGAQRIHQYCQMESEDEIVKESDFALMGAN
jgi:hypothetical protein